MWLLISAILVKIIGAIFKIPLTSILGPVGKSYYSTAYNLFIPVYQIALAGLPVAISKTVAKYVALGKFRDVRAVRKVAKRIFIITGVAGTVVIFALAYPYCLSISNTNAVYAILTVAPSVFFCCLMSSYRGYYNGLKNMIPTAASEVIEALGKLIFGLAIAKIIIAVALDRAVPGATVFGLTVTESTTEAEIMSAIYPFAAAGGISGVTLGTVFSTAFLALRHKIVGDKITHEELESSPEPRSNKALAKELLAVAIPIVTSTLIFNLINIIDSWSIQNRLAELISENSDIIGEMYASSLSGTLLEDWQNYLYGAYETAVDFKNLIPALTVTLGVSAIPVLSEAWTLKNKAAIKSGVETVLRMSMLIALPAGFGMAVLSEQILSILYYSSEETMSAIPITSTVMSMYGVIVFIIAVSQPMMQLLQAIGKTKIPVISITIGALLKVIINYFLISIPSINIYGAVIGTFACYLVSVSINIIALVKYTGVKINVVSVFFKPLLCAVLCALSAWGTQTLLSSLLSDVSFLTGRFNADNVAAIIAVVVAVVVYCVALAATKAIAREDVLSLPKGEKIAAFLEKHKIIKGSAVSVTEE